MTGPPADIAEAPGNLLAPEPAVRTGTLIGYARVSTSGHLLDRQQRALAGTTANHHAAASRPPRHRDAPQGQMAVSRAGRDLIRPSRPWIDG